MGRTQTFSLAFLFCLGAHSGVFSAPVQGQPPEAVAPISRRSVVVTLAPQFYRLRIADTNLCVSANNNSLSPLHLSPCNSAYQQQTWQVSTTGLIVSAAPPRKCLTATKGHMSHAILSPCDPKDASQTFHVEGNISTALTANDIAVGAKPAYPVLANKKFSVCLAECSGGENGLCGYFDEKLPAGVCRTSGNRLLNKKIFGEILTHTSMFTTESAPQSTPAPEMAAPATHNQHHHNNQPSSPFSARKDDSDGTRTHTNTDTEPPKTSENSAKIEGSSGSSTETVSPLPRQTHKSLTGAEIATIVIVSFSTLVAGAVITVCALIAYRKNPTVRGKVRPTAVPKMDGFCMGKVSTVDASVFYPKMGTSGDLSWARKLSHGNGANGAGWARLHDDSGMDLPDDNVGERRPSLQVLVGGRTTIMLQCTHAQATDDLVIVGNTPALGDWKVSYGQKLTRHPHNPFVFFTVIDTPTDKRLEFRFAKVASNGIDTWMDGDKQVIEPDAMGQDASRAYSWGM